jgi:hypothetical protein
VDWHIIGYGSKSPNDGPAYDSYVHDENQVFHYIVLLEP